MKVMLLAAGRGERMGALTESCPKPLLTVAGKPLLWHHLSRLKAAGFHEVVINTSYLGEQIRQFVGDGSEWGLKIQCTQETERLETGGGIFNALALLGEQPFAVVNGDVWSDFPLAQLSNVLDPARSAHLVLVSNPAHNLEGDFHLADNGEVLSLGDPKLTFSGISVLSPQLFASAQPGRFALAPLLRQAMNEGLVTGQHHKGQWIDVGTQERLQEVSTLLNSDQQNPVEE